MKWAITHHVHFDRVAAPWVIKKFIDPAAVFSFAPPADFAKLPKDVIPVAFPGAKLGPHDAEGPVFLKILNEYKLTDPALHLMADVIGKGVHYVVDGWRPPLGDRYGHMAVGILAFSDGMILIEPDDQKRLDASYIVWESLYQLFKANKQRG